VGDTAAAIAAGHRGERGEAAGGHEEVHHGVVEHGSPERAGQFVLVVMMVARRPAAAAMASTAARAARASIRISIGICKKKPVKIN